MTRLADRRVLVVGASSGIGRAIALQLSREGARVAAAARRLERLEELAKEAPGEAIAVPCDVRDESSCGSAVAQATEAFGGLDALVYAAGITPLEMLAEADAESWRSALETNLVGAALVTRAAIPALEATRGRALYVSSIASLDRPPRRGMGLYMTTKAGLDQMIRAWQSEHRSVSFTRVSVGDTGGTEAAADWIEVGKGFMEEWLREGVLFGRMMEPESVARHVADVLASTEAVPVTHIVPRYP